MSSGFARHFLNFSGKRTCPVEFPLAIAAWSSEPDPPAASDTRSATTLNEKDEVSSRLSRPAVGPERTRISCHAAMDEAACAPFRKEGRMKCTNATKIKRKSGVA